LLDFNKQARLVQYEQDSNNKNTMSYNPSKQSKSNSLFSSSSKNSQKTDQQNKILAELMRQKNRWGKTPYISGGISINGADCSGFVMSVFKESFKITIPRVTIDQMKQGKKISGSRISQRKLQVGDLLFFKTGQGMHGYHVGIYLENGDFVHLATKGGATIASLSSNYWKKLFKKSVRYNILDSY